MTLGLSANPISVYISRGIWQITSCSVTRIGVNIEKYHTLLWYLQHRVHCVWSPKGWPADLGDWFADFGGARQPVVLQGGGFLKLVSDFLMRWWMPSSMRKERQVAFWQNSGILGCLCVWGRPGGCCSIPFLVFEGSRAWTRGLVAFFFSWGQTGAEAVLVVVGDGAWPRCVLLYLSIKMQIKLNKT